MSIFEAYESELKTVNELIVKSTNDYPKQAGEGKEAKEKATTEMEALFVQAADLIKQMEVEVRSMEKDERKLFGEKITGFKKVLADQKTSFESAKNKFEREGLFGSSGVVGEKSLQQRQQMLDAQEKFNTQNEKILNMQKLVAETAEVGTEIISELERNREKIQSAQDKVNTVNADMDKAKATTKRMNDRENRCIVS